MNKHTNPETPIVSDAETKLPGKLSLRKATLRQLSASELENVAGGLPAHPYIIKTDKMGACSCPAKY